MSLFDPNAFLNATLAPSSTELKPIPQGLYEAAIEKVEVKSGESGPDSKNPGKLWTRLDVLWSITDPSVLESLGRSKVVITQGIMLEMNEDGTLATGDGKNTRLGRLRKAIGKNNGSESFLSFVGCFAKVDIGQRIYQDTVQAEVKTVSAM